MIWQEVKIAKVLPSPALKSDVLSRKACKVGDKSITDVLLRRQLSVVGFFDW